MNYKSRQAIIDKNGKHTHVWKIDDHGRHSVDRISNVKAPIKNSNGFISNGLENSLDKLEVVQDNIEQAAELLSQTDNPEHRMNVGSIITGLAIEAEESIMELELNLSAHEQEDNELYSEDEYSYGIQELMFRKASIASTLKSTGILDGPNAISYRVSRTWQDGTQDAELVFGKPTFTQHLSNGSTNLVFENESGETIVTINRLGNVTRFNNGKEGGTYMTSGIDFPVDQGDGLRLKGEFGPGVSAEDRKKIIFISTGQS